MYSVPLIESDLWEKCNGQWSVENTAKAKLENR